MTPFYDFSSAPGKRHRLVGGMKASIYNAMPLGVTTLLDFMRDFEHRHG